MPLFVVMSQKFLERPAEMVLTEWDQAIQALSADREDEALGIGVQVWAASGEPDDAHAATFEQGAKLGRMKERSPGGSPGFASS